MPIAPRHPTRRLSQAEFKDLSYGVMHQVFEIHNDLGRFFDEEIYKRELACRIPEVDLEFPIVASHKDFRREYYLDALVGDGGAFEFKTARTIAPQHRSQLDNYLLLLDLAHGKLVNMRPECVEHEFVNATLRPSDRYDFTISEDRWNRALHGSEIVQAAMVELLNDWGVGLEIGMYETYLTHALGGETRVVRDVLVRRNSRVVGHQRMRLVADGVAFRLTAFGSPSQHFEEHALRLLRHVDLKAILWVNISRTQVTFTSIE